MSFTGFPSGFPAISNAIESLLSEPLGPPPDMRSIGEKTYEIFHEKINNLDDVRTRNWRHLPYAIWLTSEKGLASETHILTRYFEVELKRSLDEARRPIKWGRPLVFIYIEKYKPLDSTFILLSKSTKDFFDSPKVSNSSPLVELARKLDLFDPKKGPVNTASSIADSRQTLREWILTNELWPSFGSSPFAEAAFSEYLKSPEDFRRSSDFIDVLFEWSLTDQNTLRYSAVRAKIADSILLPWRGLQPSEALKSRLLSFLLHHYGDPRIGSNLWFGVSKEAIQVLISWINGRTLEAFFKILEKTADSIWQYRQRFWMAYFKADYIDEVWFALGPDAAAVLKSLDDSNQLKFANLLASDPTQSVLLIKIGSILFCEWSHNGRLRAERFGSPESPAMYKPYYYAEDLRFESLDFNYGQLQDPGLVHFSSQTGGWQERASSFIQKQTGIRMPRAELVR